jgi:hypothetical protein
VPPGRVGVCGPLRLGYGLANFDFGPDNVITPHAHHDMASAHMVIEGKLRVRTFDRVKDEENHLIVQPTQDVLAEPGHAAAMTTAKDNVHWFAPRSPRAMTIDVIIDGLEKGLGALPHRTRRRDARKPSALRQDSGTVGVVRAVHGALSRWRLMPRAGAARHFPFPRTIDQEAQTCMKALATAARCA